MRDHNAGSQDGSRESFSREGGIKRRDRNTGSARASARNAMGISFLIHVGIPPFDPAF